MSLQQQMSLFQEGGLEQDGNTVDPVSGNDVPVGSSQEEVRDDIPAQLSEGEFVFPADVVRFIGLEKLMMMRQEAKAGLKRMEEMGQMGNAEEATVPDDLPFTIDDLDMEDDPQEMAQGGVMAANGVFTQPSNFKRIPEIGINPPPPENAQQPIVDEQATFYNAPTQTTEQQPVASFEDLFGGDVSYGYDELRKYVGPNGEIEYVAFKDGEPLPAYTQKLKELTDKGFTYEDPAETSQEDKDVTDVGVETAQVRPDKENDSTSPQNMRKAEQERIQSFKNAIEAVMKETGITDPTEAAQYIKDGNHKIKGIKVPGFLFTDFNLVDGKVDASGIARPATYGLDQAAEEIFNNLYNQEPPRLDVTSPSTTTGTTSSATADTTADTTAGTTAGTTADIVSKDITDKTVDNKPFNEGPPSLSDRPVDLTKPNVVASNIQDPSDIKPFAKAATDYVTQQNKAKADAMAAAKAKEQRKAEAEANRAKTEKEKTRIEDVLKDRGRGSIKRGFEQGGLATKKPKKKKTMKRGGLASKK